MLNPYEAPQSVVKNAFPRGAGVRADGKHLIVTNGSALPMRCLKCNAECGEADVRITKKLHFASPWIYVLLLVNIIVLVIVYYIVRKPVEISFSRCHLHAKVLSKNRSICGISLIIALISGIIGISYELPALTILALISLVTFLIVLIRVTNAVVLVKHHKGEFWLKGAGPDFLHSFDS